MILTQAYAVLVQEAIIAAAAFNPAAGSEFKLALTTNEFTPDPTLTIADLDLAAEAGIAPKVLPAGQTLYAVMDENGRLGFYMNEPAGGFNFVCDELPEAPITVTGWALCNNALTTLIASDRLETTKVIQKVGEFVNLSALFGFLPAVLLEQPDSF